MRKRVLGLLLGAAVAGALMTGCSGGGQTQTTEAGKTEASDSVNPGESKEETGEAET